MTPFQNPTIYLGALRIDEPVTTITDFILCAVCFFAFLKIKPSSQNKAINLYRWFFLLTGVSTILAALFGHAFLYYFGFEAKMFGWLVGILSVSVAQLAAIYHAEKIINKAAFNRLKILSMIETIIAFIAVFIAWNFVVVEIHSTYSLLLIVTTLEFIKYKKTNSKLSAHIIYGVGIAVLAVLCHVFKIAISVWFNHMDISHVFMAISTYVMYKGVKRES